MEALIIILKTLIIITAIIAVLFFALKFWINKTFKTIPDIELDCSMKEISDQLFDRE